MAMYNMNKEVREIAEITGKSEDLVAQELGISKVGDEWTAWSRREEWRVKSALTEAKEKAA